jgi:hypothetical protein
LETRGFLNGEGEESPVQMYEFIALYIMYGGTTPSFFWDIIEKGECLEEGHVPIISVFGIATLSQPDTLCANYIDKVISLFDSRIRNTWEHSRYVQDMTYIMNDVILQLSYAVTLSNVSLERKDHCRSLLKSLASLLVEFAKNRAVKSPSKITVYYSLVAVGLYINPSLIEMPGDFVVGAITYYYDKVYTDINLEAEHGFLVLTSLLALDHTLWPKFVKPEILVERLADLHEKIEFSKCHFDWETNFYSLMSRYYKFTGEFDSDMKIGNYVTKKPLLLNCPNFSTDVVITEKNNVFTGNFFDTCATRSAIFKGPKSLQDHCLAFLAGNSGINYRPQLGQNNEMFEKLKEYAYRNRITL